MASGLAIRTLLDVWCNCLEKWPRKAGAIYQDRAWTYAELDQAARRLAWHMQTRFGVAKGDRVAIAMPNCVEFLLTYWAAIRLGAVVVPINIRMEARGIAFILNETEAKVLFVHQENWKLMQQALAGAGPVRRLVACGFKTDDAEAFGALIERAVGESTDADVQPDDLAVVVYTSGTTGDPKGPMLTHDNLIYNIRNTIYSHSLRHEDVHLLVVPLFHCTGLNSIITSAAYQGATVVIAPRPDVTELVPMMARHKVTTFLGVPTLHYFLVNMKTLAQHDLSRLRLIAYSGSPMPAATIRALRRAFPGVWLHNFFGLTETISITNVLSTCDADDRPDSVGPALPDVGMKILDDQGVELRPGEVGELCFHRYNVVQGYWRRPSLLEQSFSGDWFRTGDYALVDEQGYLYLKGRKKDMIIVGGENVYANEVEHVLCAHEKVLEAAVVGVEATGMLAYLGEIVKAVIVCKPGEKVTDLEIKRHCSGRLPTYKVPRIVEFREALPRTPSGKVRKRDLK
jgi:acyl-CoA synthetase (AMP-forming)/AMP-acid ligase II